MSLSKSFGAKNTSMMIIANQILRGIIIMLNIFMFVRGVNDDEEIPERFSEQDVSVLDRDIIIAISIENDLVIEFVCYDKGLRIEGY